MNWIHVVLLGFNVVVAHAGIASTSNDMLEKDLYTAVVNGNYYSAVLQTKLIEQLQKGEVINGVVTKLIEMKERNIVEYAYKLWTNDETRPIVEHYFPIQFRLLFNESYVEVMNKLYKTYLGVRTPPAAAGGSNNRTLLTAFKLIPIWWNHRIYFKILNIDCNAYSFLDRLTHRIYSSQDSDTTGHQWYLRPVKYENDLLFIIYNRLTDNSMGLRDINGDGVEDEQQVSRDKVQDRPDLYGWLIVPSSYNPVILDCWN